jgi:hypothetical protein
LDAVRRGYLRAVPSVRPPRKPSSGTGRRARGGDGASTELLAESLLVPPLDANVDAASLLEESESYVEAVATALAGLSDAGFPAHFEVDDDGVHCLACRSRCNPADVSWMAHAEVTSANRSSYVCGLRCPVCGSRGTATVTVEQWERRREPPARSHTSR